MSQNPETPEVELSTQAADRVSDAPSDNWVDRYAPARSRPFLRLSRADRPIGTWLLFIPCVWGLTLAAAIDAFKLWDLWLAGSCFAGAFLMRGAGCTWNDISDRKFDAQVARTRSRPLPSGQVTVKAAVVWMAFQAVIAAFILYSYNDIAIGLGIGSLLLVGIYPFAKRFTWWPQLFLGLAFNWGALLAWAAHAGNLPPAAIFLYLAGIFWTLFYDTVYAHQDKEDDALIGVKSTARLFGNNTAFWLRVFLVLSVTCMGIAVILALLPRHQPLQMVVALAGAWAFGWHMVRQMLQLDIDDPSSCLRVFRANRDAGLLPALFLAAAAFM